jgi:hypothetical protein
MIAAATEIRAVGVRGPVACVTEHAVAVVVERPFHRRGRHLRSSRERQWGRFRTVSRKGEVAEMPGGSQRGGRGRCQELERERIERER